jgi:hypothetical protein
MVGGSQSADEQPLAWLAAMLARIQKDGAAQVAAIQAQAAAIRAQNNALITAIQTRNGTFSASISLGPQLAQPT